MNQPTPGGGHARTETQQPRRPGYVHPGTDESGNTDPDVHQPMRGGSAVLTGTRGRRVGGA